VSQNAQPELSTAPLGEEPTDAGDPEQPPTDPAALRATVAVLERDLAAREAQVSAMREQYETALAAHDDDEDRDLRTDGGGGLLARLRRTLEL